MSTINLTPNNGRPATCVSTGVKCPKGTAYMIPTQRCDGGKAISVAAFDEFLKTGKLEGSKHRPDKVSEPHDIFMEFTISVPNADRDWFVAKLVVEGWSIVGKVNQVTYKVRPAKPFLTCRGLQQALTTFDNIVADNNAKITKFSSVVDGKTIPEYVDSYTYYQKVDETCRERKTTIRENRLIEKNIKKVKAKKK